MGDIEFTRPGLSVRVTQGDPAVVTAVGEVDIASVGALADGLEEAAGDPVTRDVAAELDRVEFIDVGGVRTLVTADEKIAKAGHRFGIRSVSKMVRRLLDLLQFSYLVRPRP